jgi:hypothetical protein
MGVNREKKTKNSNCESRAFAFNLKELLALFNVIHAGTWILNVNGGRFAV